MTDARQVGSKFRILCNTNRNDLDANQVERLKWNMARAIKRLQLPSECIKILKVPDTGIVDDDPDNHTSYEQKYTSEERPLPQRIDGIIGHAKFERGDLTGYPHWHINIQVNHTTRIHISRSGLVLYLIRGSGGILSIEDGIFVRSDNVRATMDARYLFKDLNKKEEEQGAFSLFTRLIEVYDEDGELMPLLPPSSNDIVAIIEEPEPVIPPIIQEEQQIEAHQALGQRIRQRRRLATQRGITTSSPIRGIPYTEPPSPRQQQQQRTENRRTRLQPKRTIRKGDNN